MGRRRSFDTDEVVALAADVFGRTGYHGTSVDDLLRATGIQRASLYQAFGSKRGLFVEALTRTADDDVVLVAAMDLAADDAEIRAIVADRLRAGSQDPAAGLGRLLLARAHLTDLTPTPTPQEHP